MLSNILALATLALTLSLQVNAHASISPMLGVSGKPARSDVQRPSKDSECGNVDIAKTIDSSTAVQAAADGTFSATVTNFNAGKDGSRQVTLKVDSTGVGKSFVAGTVSKNGDSNPTSVGSIQIVAALPPGTQCTGGKSNDLCLASFATTAGFGNCVVIKQGNAADTPADSLPKGQTAAAGTGSADGANDGAANPNGKGNDSVHNGAHSDCGGTRENTKKGGSKKSTKGGEEGAGSERKSNDKHEKHKNGKKHKKHHKGTRKGKDSKKGGHKDTRSSAVGTRAPRAVQQEFGTRKVVAGVKRGFTNWIWA